MEIVIQGNTYNIGKMDLDFQLHVARRLAPIMYAFSAGLLDRLRSGEPVTGVDNLKGTLDAIHPMVTVFCAMSDADVDYVTSHTLAVCQRKTGEGPGAGFQIVRAAGARTMQFQDIDLMVMMELVFSVVKDNLGNFLRALIERLEAVTSLQD